MNTTQESTDAPAPVLPNALTAFDSSKPSPDLQAWASQFQPKPGETDSEGGEAS